MAVIASRVIDGNKHLFIGLQAIYGIGRSRALDICDAVNIASSEKVKDLDEDQLTKIRAEVAKYTIEGDLRREVSMNIKRLMDIGCYRGIRHRLGLPIKGRTHTNGKTARKKRSR